MDESQSRVSRGAAIGVVALSLGFGLVRSAIADEVSDVSFASAPGVARPTEPSEFTAHGPRTLTPMSEGTVRDGTMSEGARPPHEPGREPSRPSGSTVTPPLDAADAAPRAERHRPVAWQQGRGRDCRRRRSRVICDGPLRVPEPAGPAKALAEQLGLGTFSAASRLLGGRPLGEWVTAAGRDVTRTLRWPVAARPLGRGFGFVRPGRLRRRLHPGMDIGGAAGTAVEAVAGGLVAYAGNEVSGYGNLVMLLHGDGAVTVYAHLRAAWVFAGERVARGEVLGEMGMTGLAGGPHLHFELRQNGRPRDPLRRFTDRPSRHAPFELPHDGPLFADAHGSVGARDVADACDFAGACDFTGAALVASARDAVDTFTPAP